MNKFHRVPSWSVLGTKWVVKPLFKSQFDHNSNPHGAGGRRLGCEHAWTQAVDSETLSREWQPVQVCVVTPIRSRDVGCAWSACTMKVERCSLNLVGQRAKAAPRTCTNTFCNRCISHFRRLVASSPTDRAVRSPTDQAAAVGESSPPSCWLALGISSAWDG